MYNVPCQMPGERSPDMTMALKNSQLVLGARQGHHPEQKKQTKKKRSWCHLFPFQDYLFFASKLVDILIVLEEKFDSWKRGNLDAESHTQREGYVEIHKENSMWRWRIWVMHPQAKECLPLPEASKEHGTDSSLCLQRKHGLFNTLV